MNSSLFKKSLITGIIFSTFNITVADSPDNTQLFNNAMNIGSQHQPSLNLEQNSTISSYGHQHKFDPKVANNANVGNSNAKSIYSSEFNNPNYLYNNGVQEIKNCEHESDPRCTTINKYGDKGTQTEIQSYAHGIATRYYLAVAPDPEDKSCSIIKRKAPINQNTETCSASTKQYNECNNTIIPDSEKLAPEPIDGTVLHNLISPGVCGVGSVSGSWIPQGDRAWFIITSNEGSFNSGTLPVVMGATSGKTPCISASSSIVTIPTRSRLLLGKFYIDWLNSQKGNIAFYQEPGQNCGVDKKTLMCTINLTLAWENGAVLNSWVITFARPKTRNYARHYKYINGCSNAQ